MPLLSIETNQDLDSNARSALLQEASSLTAERLGKSQAYVMVRFNHNPDMRFGGADDPLAFVQLKSIGLGEDMTTALSATLCGLLERRLAVPPDRVYIEFVDAPRRMWGFDGRTF